MIVHPLFWLNWLVLSYYIEASPLLRARNQSQDSIAQWYPIVGQTDGLDSVPISREPYSRMWIVTALPDQITAQFVALFWQSPALAQTIPCLPPLGDWSGNYISSGFGWRNHPTLRTVRHHDGIDIAGPHQYVRAAAAGQVRTVSYSKTLGHYVCIDHLNSYRTVYGHLSLTLVRVGQTLRIGETLGITGRSGRATGVHLHYSITKQNVPVDPVPYLTLAIDVVRTYQQQARRQTGSHP